MMLEQRLSAAQLASLALSCGLLTFGIITVNALPDPAHISIRATLWIGGLEFLFGVAAAMVMYKALAAFQRGIDDCRWNQPSLDKLKKQLNHPAATAFIWLLLAVLIGYLAVDLTSHWFRHHHIQIGGLAYFWMSPAYAIGSLRGSLKPKLPMGQSIWRDEVKPIHSEHWGSRGPVEV
jgi:hypothetical protein